MDIFDDVYNKVMKIEGGYCKRKADAGGETYKGISRKYHPKWGGWTTIDIVKGASKDINKDLALDIQLQEMVKYFYKKNYWSALKLWGINSRMLASKLFDIAVNCGKIRAIKYLQRSLNVLNRYEKDWKDIKVDGKIGPTTLGVTNKAIGKTFRKSNLVKSLHILQGMHYIKLAENPKRLDELNINGWLHHRIGFLNIIKKE